MNFPATLTLRRTALVDRRAPHRRRSERRPPAASPAPAQPAARKAGLPSQDKATYNCVCGFVWAGEVTTSVGCPHCGTAQAW